MEGGGGTLFVGEGEVGLAVARVSYLFAGGAQSGCRLEAPGDSCFSGLVKQ